MNRACMIVASVLASAATPGLCQFIPSGNDPGAQYVDGAFTLPDTIGPKQYYVIVIQAPGAKDVTIRLPEGSNVTRLVPAARPNGTWNWTYRRRPVEGAAIDVTSQSGPVVARIGDLTTIAADKQFLTVEWKHLPGAAKYRIVTRDVTRRDGAEIVGRDNPPIAVDPLDELRDSTGVAELTTIPFYIPAAPGQSFQWRVEAQDDKDYVLASSAPQRVDVADKWYAGLSKAGFSLQRAEQLTIRELRKGDALLAFSQSSSDARGSTPATHNVRSFSSEFALLWRSPRNLLATGGDVLIPTASIEARLNSSGEAKANDVFRGRIGMGWISNAPAFDSAANAKWEHDRKSGVEKTMLELAVTPLFNPIGVLLPRYDQSRTDFYGNVRPGMEYPIQFGFTPTLGVDVGRTTKSAADTVERDNVLRYFGTLRVDVEANLLASLLQIPRVSGWGTFTTRYLADEPSDRRKDFVSAGLEFWLAPNLGLAATYKVGRDAPAFQWGRNFGLGIAVRFN